MRERGLWPAKKPNGECSIHLPANGLPPFLTLPSPRASYADFFAKGFVLFLNVLVRTRHKSIVLPLGTLLRNALPGNGCF
ncbi:hypothetical protein, partial [Pseudorhodobacter ferrugineus]|uniref:hypothetical protein n=1 Tax=Pseudorhodobacter ferrugineus TaxID=77008 RepID=UPI0005271AE6